MPPLSRAQLHRRDPSGSEKTGGGSWVGVARHEGAELCSSITDSR